MENQASTKTPTFLILIIGVVIGLLVAAGFALVKGGLNRKGGTPTVETKGIVLSIDKPVDGEVVSESTIQISGTTGKDVLVTIVGGTEDVFTEATTGAFSAQVSLVEGESELTLYAFDTESGETTTVTLNILYLKEELGTAPVLVASSHEGAVEKNKERIEQLRQEVATKSDELKKAATNLKKTHVAGTLTATAGTTLTIETKGAGTKTVFTDDFTKFFLVSSGGGKQAINLGDLKIGELLAVVGIAKSDSSGTAKFVVRYTKGTGRHAIFGKVASTTANAITLTHLVQTDRNFTVKVDASTTVAIKGKGAAALSDIKVDDVVIATGALDTQGTLTAAKIFVVPGKRTGQEPKESTNSATPSSQ